jgi:hypothetical protein
VDNEVKQLKDRIAELEELLGLQLEFPKIKIKGIRKIGWPILGVLLKHPLATNEFIFRAVYGNRLEADQPNILVIATHMSRLNKALRQHGVRIENQYGEGYFLNDENKRRLNELVRPKEDNDRSIDPVVGRIRHRYHNSVEPH